MNDEISQQIEKLKTNYKKDVECELEQIKDYYNKKMKDGVMDSESNKYRGLIRDKNAALSKKWYELCDQLTDDVAEVCGVKRTWSNNKT